MNHPRNTRSQKSQSLKFSSLFLLALIFCANPAQGQSPINSDVALQPGTGVVMYRQLFKYFEAGGDPSPLGREVKTTLSSSTFAYGIHDGWTGILNIPTFFRETHVGSTGATLHDEGVGDLTLLAKYRVFRDDTGVNDTTRLSLVGGLEIPSGDDVFSSESYDPIFGGVFTKVVGRQSFNGDMLWKFNTGGEADRLKFDTSYVYRLFPERYSGPDPTVLFGVLELNGFYETNGDLELFLSPGLVYNTQTFTIEATVQIPVVQNLDRRLEKDFVVGLGVKFRF